MAISKLFQGRSTWRKFLVLDRRPKLSLLWFVEIVGRKEADLCILVNPRARLETTRELFASSSAFSSTELAAHVYRAER